MTSMATTGEVVEQPALVSTSYLDTQNMIKLQGETGAVCSAPASDTTSPGKEIVMPLDDSKQAALDVAIRQIEQQFGHQPRPATPKKRYPQVVRRGAKREALDLPWLATPSLYMMQCTTCGLVKVGVSGDYRLRRTELEKRTGHTLRVLGFDYGTFEIESWAHAYMTPYRVEGEWYTPSEYVLEYARKLRYHPEDDQS